MKNNKLTKSKIDDIYFRYICSIIGFLLIPLIGWGMYLVYRNNNELHLFKIHYLVSIPVTIITLYLAKVEHNYFVKRNKKFISFATAAGIAIALKYIAEDLLPKDILFHTSFVGALIIFNFYIYGFFKTIYDHLVLLMN